MRADSSAAQLGDTGDDDQPRPEQISTATNWASVAAGFDQDLFRPGPPVVFALFGQI